MNDSRRPQGGLGAGRLLPLLSTLPLLAYFVYCTWVNPISPQIANYDPEFQYLMNSLEVFKGKAYSYVDHPGTPLELVGSVIYAATYPVLGKAPNDFILYHLQNPGVFLTVAHGLLLLANMASMLYLASAVASAGRPVDLLLACALPLMPFAIHPLAFWSLMLWSHNSFSLPCGTFLLVYLYKQLAAGPPNRMLSARSQILLGVFAGVLASVAIYLTAWIFGILAVILLSCRLRLISWRRTLAACATIVGSGAAGFTLAVSPVIGNMPSFFEWLHALLTHRVDYLRGPAGTAAGSRLIANYLDLAHQLPALFISVGVAMLLLVAAFIRLRPGAKGRVGLWALALGLIAQMVVLTAFIINLPRAEYLFAVAAVAPVLVLCLLRLLEDLHGVADALKWLTIVLVLAGTAMLFNQAIVQQQMDVASVSRAVTQTAQSTEQFARITNRAADELVVLWTYPSFAPCFSLWFGNDSTGRAFTSEISQICPREHEFDRWNLKIFPPSLGSSSLHPSNWDLIVGCEDTFAVPVLANLPVTQTFPDLPLGCGSLKIAYNR